MWASAVFAADGRNVVTNFQELAVLSREANVRPAEFDVEATVVSAMPPGARSIVLTDGTIGAYVAPGRNVEDVPSVKRGDRVRVRGRLMDAAPNLPSARYSHLSVIGEGATPDARDVRIGEIRAGRCDWEWVRVGGLVRDILPSETNVRWLIMVLCADGETLYVSLFVDKRPAAEFMSLIGRTVDICGYTNPQTGSHRRYMGRILQCPDPSNIVVRTEAKSPFDAPHVSRLKYLDPEQIAASGPVLASGVVTASWGGGHALVDCGKYGNMHLVLDDAKPPARGQSVEVVGFPQSNLFNLTLTHAHWRETAPIEFTQDEPKAISAHDVFTASAPKPSRNARLHGKTVRLKAVVHSLADPLVRSDTLLVEDAGFVIPVDVSAAPEAAAGISVGCKVEITGICVLKQESWRPDRLFPQIEGFMVIVQEPGAIRILARPPWWTAGRLWSFIGMLLAVLAGILAWNVALRRAAARKGRELLREQIGHMKTQLKKEERTRLAVELHDSLAQSLTGVSLEVDTAMRLADGRNTAMMEHLGIASRTLNSCRNELRHCLWDLRNHALEERTMDEAIRQTLAPHVAGVDVTLRFDLPRTRIPDNTAHAILRIIRELALNAIRHGQATKIWIAGCADGPWLRFSVRDNGCGFDPHSASGIAEGHYGLLGIQERIEALEGEFNIDSVPGKGTNVRMSIKLPYEGREPQK